MKSIGKYHLEKRLGKGYFGVTYKARDTVAEIDVAVKVISKPWFDKNWFKREVTPLIKLKHRNIVHYLECNYVGNGTQRRWYVVTELANQGTLADKIGKISYSSAVRYALEILDGLSASHRQQIIHNDLKPENILIHDGCVKLADFGISRHSQHTVVGQAAGTPLYMAPERFLAEESSQRSDIWAVGVVFYQMLTGRLPFYSPSEIVQYQPSPKQLVKEGIPSELTGILAKALAHPKKERYKDALSFRNAIYETTIKGTKVMRAEQGIVGWDWDGQPHTHRSFKVKFAKPFNSKPIIQTSITMMHSWSDDDKQIRIWCSSSNVETTSADIEVGTWQNNKIGGVKIQWTAIGE